MKLNLTIILLLYTTFAYSQYAKLANGMGVELKGREAALAKKYMTCVNSHRFYVKQRRTFFPFNSAVTIKIISFADTVRPYQPLKVNNFAINPNEIIESKTLTEQDIDALTDILYNVGYSPIKLPFKLVDPGHNCYVPRNAIIFLNAADVVTQYIELCFSCQRYFLSSSKIKNTQYCEQKFEMLRQFFFDRDIKYGTAPQGSN